MKSIQLTFLALLFSIAANAQDITKGIQVTVYDTIQLVPDRYEIIIMKAISENPYLDSTNTNKITSDYFKSTVERYFKNHNLKYNSRKTFGFQGEKDYYKATLLYKEYKDFYKEFGNSSLVTYVILKKESNKIAEFEKTLDERLIVKAKSRGEQLSKLSGLKVSTIATVKEVPYNQVANSDEGWSVYPPLSLLNYAGENPLGNEYNEKIILSKGLEVFFLTN
jgi:hypothetical protein